MKRQLAILATLMVGLPGTSAMAQNAQSLTLPADHATPLWRARQDADQQAVIAEIQRHLQTLGLYRRAIDGIHGSGTWAAKTRPRRFTARPSP